MIIFNPLACLIHQQIRAEWVPAARSCRITSGIEICRAFHINLLITDVILLFIMLAGWLRLRRGEGSFYLSNLLWKQVGHCRFLLVVMLLSHCFLRFLGCHLARYCHRRRTPASGKPACVIVGHTASLYLTPFYAAVASLFECER
jgi:hypothetical protein